MAKKTLYEIEGIRNDPEEPRVGLTLKLKSKKKSVRTFMALDKENLGENVNLLHEGMEIYLKRKKKLFRKYEIGFLYLSKKEKPFYFDKYPC